MAVIYDLQAYREGKAVRVKSAPDPIISEAFVNLRKSLMSKGLPLNELHPQK